jgi:RNA polymerase sigma-70 factor (ECF subfamily)
VNSTRPPETSNDARLLGSLLDAGKPFTPESDWVDLVHRITSRDQTALRELYERTHRIVFTVALRILNDPSTAEEVTLDVFHGVWERAASYDPKRGQVVGWIMNQAQSKAIDRIRHEHRKKRVGTAKVDGGTQEESFQSPIEEQRRLLAGALEALTIDERRAIETAYFEELTYAEAAERLELPLGTIKTRIRSGLAKLRTLLPHKEDA